MLIPAYQLVAVVNTLAAAAAAGLSGRPFTFAAGAFCGAILLNVGLTAVFATLSGALVLTVERKWDRRLWKSLLVYWLFLLSWLPITIGSFSSRLRSGRRSGTPAMCCRSRSWPGSGDTCGKRRTAHAHGRSSQFVGKALLQKLRGPMGGTKSKPNAVDSIWNGGARERQNECAMSFAIEMKSSWQAICRLPRAGAEGGIRTLARFNPSTPFSRGAPYSHLGTSAAINSASSGKRWRREWDSNPRLLRVTGFQDRLLKPLGHLSLLISNSEANESIPYFEPYVNLKLRFCGLFF